MSTYDFIGHWGISWTGVRLASYQSETGAPAVVFVQPKLNGRRNSLSLLWIQPGLILKMLADDSTQLWPNRLKRSSTSEFNWTINPRCAIILTKLQRLVSAFVLSRIDYCNSVLAGLPQSTLRLLLEVLDAAIRVVAGLGPHHRCCSALAASTIQIQI